MHFICKRDCGNEKRGVPIMGLFKKSQAFGMGVPILKMGVCYPTAKFVEQPPIIHVNGITLIIIRA